MQNRSSKYSNDKCQGKILTIDNTQSSLKTIMNSSLTLVTRRMYEQRTFPSIAFIFSPRLRLKTHTHTHTHTHTQTIIIIIYPLSARVVGAPEMISQPVSSIFVPALYCPMGLGELQASPFPNLVVPPLPLSALSSSPIQCALQDGFGQT